MRALERFFRKLTLWLPENIGLASSAEKREAAMFAALSRMKDDSTLGPLLGQISARDIARLAELYEIEIRRNRGRKPKTRRNVERDRRIFAAREAGKSVKAIALDEGLSEGRVSQILSGPRP